MTFEQLPPCAQTYYFADYFPQTACAILTAAGWEIWAETPTVYAISDASAYRPLLLPIAWRLHACGLPPPRRICNCGVCARVRRR